ncbi:MAG: 50S ribosomal protein L10 [Rickettsiales bacterium]|nr:50S ribosomal protein L10 [Rickettsiales bacterium]
MDRAQKQAYVKALNTGVADAASIVVVHYKGLTVDEITELRAKVRAAGGSFRVTKNTLAKRALKGTAYESLGELLTGPTAIGYSDDPVAPAKALVNFANENDKLQVLGGAFGEQVLDVNGVTELSKMPSLDELRATIVGMLNTPATRIAGVLQAPAGQLARVCGAYGAKS